MDHSLIFLFLLIAVACGWALGVWQARNKSDKRLPRNQYELAQYFIDDMPDYALDAFIAAVDVNQDTIEMHLTLGGVHRRRGELQQAIKVHENLIRRDGLRPAQVSLARFELALDYFKAGLHDRAEEFLQDLVQTSESHRVPALHLLMELYQLEHEWLKAAYAANVLTDYVDPENVKKLDQKRCHFHCELAANALSEKDFLSARRSIDKAERLCTAGSRPQLLSATLDKLIQQPKKAKKTLEHLVLTGAQGVDQAISLLRDIATEQDNLDEYAAFLCQVLEAQHSVHVLKALVLHYAALNQDDALNTLFKNMSSEQLGRIPLSLFSGLDRRTRKHLGSRWLANATIKGNSDMDYCCSSCGYHFERHHWQCPKCREWETLEVVTA